MIVDLLFLALALPVLAVLLLGSLVEPVAEFLWQLFSQLFPEAAERIGNFFDDVVV